LAAESLEVLEDDEKDSGVYNCTIFDLIAVFQIIPLAAF